MRLGWIDPRVKAVVAAALLVVFGAAAGITADRLLSGRAPAPAGAEPLTLTALSEALDLDASQQARVREVLDSLEAEIAAAAPGGADSLRAVAREASRRLEEALPPDRRSGFRAWMHQHGQRMMHEMQRWMGPRQGGRMMGRGMGGMMGGRMRGGMMGGRKGPGMGLAAPPTIDSAKLPEPASRGAALLNRYCTNCHALPDPAAHTAREWPAVVERMQGNMSGAAVPAPDETEAGELLRYLQAHGRR